MRKRFDVNYYKAGTSRGRERVWSHVYSEDWEFLPDTFCPNCGHKGVWANLEGDFYVGNQHICTQCEYSFHLPSCDKITKDDKAEQQRLVNLKA